MTTASSYGRAELALALHQAGLPPNAAEAQLLSNSSDIYQVKRADGKLAIVAKLGNGFEFAPRVIGWGYHFEDPEEKAKAGYRNIPSAGYGDTLADAVIGVLAIDEAWFPRD